MPKCDFIFSEKLILRTSLASETLGDRSHDVNKHITCPLWLNRLVISHPKSIVIYLLTDFNQ